MEKENKCFYLFPKGGNYTSLPVGLLARLAVHLTDIGKTKGEKIRVPKYAIPVLIYLCELAQLGNLYKKEKDKTLPVETSSREIAKAIGIKNHSTVNNTLLWLFKNNWIDSEKGSNQLINTAIWVNEERIKNFLKSPS